MEMVTVINHVTIIKWENIVYLLDVFKNVSLVIGLV